MKRNLVILLICVIVFFTMCLSSCTIDLCVCGQLDTEAELTVLNCNMCSDHPTTIKGCHFENDCIDCYWFPFLCGCYGNDFTGNEEIGKASCPIPSIVFCGFDFTLLECYGTNLEKKDHNTDIETSNVVEATEGVDYTIDRVVIRVNDEDIELGKNFSIEANIETLLSLIMLQSEVEIKYFVEYTALKELHSVELNCEFEYDSMADFSKNFTRKVNVKAGNIQETYGEPNYKSENIKPGKHIITATASLNMYEILALEDMTNFYFRAYGYED